MQEKQTWADSPILALTQTRDISVHGATTRWFKNLFTSLSQNFGLKFHIVGNDFKIHGINDPRLDFVRLSPGKINFTDLPFFYYKLLKHTTKFLSNHKNSLIHHVILVSRGIESIDLIAINNKKDGHPLLIGPAESGHPFLKDDFAISTEMEFRQIQYPLMKGFRQLLDPILNVGYAKTLHECDHLVVVNEATKKIFAKDISPKKMTVIPYGVNVGEFEFSPPSPNHIVLSVGSLIERKNFWCLLRAMKLVKKEYPDASLKIIGDGPQFTKLTVEAENAGFPLAIRGWVARKELYSSLKTCSVFCQPSFAESFSHSTLEAMASGKPVVSTQTIGSEMVENGSTGFLVPVDDETALASKIMHLFADYDLSFKMGQEARKVVEDKYSWGAISQCYYKIYQKLGDRLPYEST